MILIRMERLYFTRGFLLTLFHKVNKISHQSLHDLLQLEMTGGGGTGERHPFEVNSSFLINVSNINSNLPFVFLKASISLFRSLKPDYISLFV